MAFASNLTSLYFAAGAAEAENSVNDLVGSNDLTAAGSASFGTSTPDPAEGTYRTTANNNTDYYQIPSGAVTTAAGRIEGYIRTAGGSAYGSVLTVSDRTWASFNRYMIFRMDATDSKWRLQYTKPTDTSIASTGTWSANTWYHFAICWTAGAVKLYIDNVEVASSADTIDFGTVNSARLGWHVVAGSNTTAFFDELAFYSAYSTGPFPTDHVFTSGSAIPTWTMRRRRRG